MEGADHRPLDRRVDLPPPDPVGVDRRTSGRGVGLEQLGQLSETAHPAGPTEPPGSRAQPAEVLGRVPCVGKLPVEHGPQALRPDEQVAHPEITVHRDPTVGRGSVDRQPACPELQCGADLAELVEDREGIGEGVVVGQSGDGVGVDGVDGRQRRATLRREGTAGVRPFGVTQELPGDRLAENPIDDEPARVEARSLPGRDHPGHGDAGTLGRLEQV